MAGLDILFNNKPRFDNLLDIYTDLVNENRENWDIILAYLDNRSLYIDLTLIEYFTLLKIFEKIPNDTLNSFVRIISDLNMLKSLVICRRIESKNISKEMKEQLGFFTIYLYNSCESKEIELELFDFYTNTTVQPHLKLSVSNNNSYFFDRLLSFSKHFEKDIDNQEYQAFRVSRNNFTFFKINMKACLCFNINPFKYLDFQKHSKLKEYLHFCDERINLFLSPLRSSKEKISFSPYELEHIENRITPFLESDLGLQEQKKLYKKEIELLSELALVDYINLNKNLSTKASYSVFTTNSFLTNEYSLENNNTSYTKIYSEYVESCSEVQVKFALSKVKENQLEKLALNSHLFSNLNFLRRLSNEDLIYKFLMDLKLENHTINFKYILRNKFLHTKEFSEKYCNNIFYDFIHLYNGVPIYREFYDLPDYMIKDFKMEQIKKTF